MNDSIYLRKGESWKRQKSSENIINFYFQTNVQNECISSMLSINEKHSNLPRRVILRFSCTEPVTSERGRTISRISVAKGSNLNFRGRKSNSLMNLCGKTAPKPIIHHSLKIYFKYSRTYNSQLLLLFWVEMVSHWYFGYVRLLKRLCLHWMLNFILTIF